MLVDTHAHLMDRAFADDLAAVLHRAAEAGVAAMVCVGYDLASSRAAVRLAEAHPHLLAAVGIHPNSARDEGPRAFDEIRRLAAHPRVVGIGETGLDRYRKRTPFEEQRASFRRHLDLAAERGLPVIVHNREADADTAEMLSEWAAVAPANADGLRGVLHCFAGDARMLRAGLDAGFMVSFAGPVTFKNAPNLAERARETPLDRLVVETDCPYLTPHPHRGQRNEPARVRLTAARLAELHALPLAEIERATTDNARRIFPLLASVLPAPVASPVGPQSV